MPPQLATPPGPAKIFEYVTPLNVLGLFALYVVAKALLAFVRASRSPLQKLPGPKPHSWAIGDLPHIMMNPTGSVLKAWDTLYGRTFRVSSGAFMPPNIVTTDTTAVAFIQRNPDMFIKPPLHARILGRVAGNGVLMAEFGNHRRQRRVLNPVFSPAAIRDMIPIIYIKATELRDRLAITVDENPKHDASPTPPKPEDIVPGARKIDMGRFLTEAAFDIIGLAGFDYNFHCQQRSNPIVQGFRDAISNLMTRSPIAILQHFFPALDVIPTKRLRLVDESLKRTMDVGRELIDRKRADLGSVEKSTETSKDLLTLIVKANLAHDLPDHQRLSDEELIHQVSTFLLAGSETTSNALSWLLWRLAQKPDVQQRLRDEMNALGVNEPTLEDLDKLPLLENCIREALRTDSPVPETFREATMEAVIPLGAPVLQSDGKEITEVTIKKGGLVQIPFSVLHTNKDIWGEDADEWNPDRHDRPGIPMAKVPGVYGNLIAFNGGPRNCIGYRFALAEMKVILYVLIRSFKFDLLPSNPEITRKNFIVMLPWVVGEEEVGSQMPLMLSHVKE